MKQNLVIIGAGGLAREVYDLFKELYPGQTNEISFKGFLSDGPSNVEELGYPRVIGTVSSYMPAENDVFLCAIGKVRDRVKKVWQIKERGGIFINLVHPKAIVAPSVKFGEGIIIKAFCVLDSHVEIGSYTYLQSSVIAGHDVQIGAFCQVNSFSFFAGNVKVEDMCTINAGARIIQGVKVETEAVVGIGSVVLRKVKQKTTVFGNPAKIIRN